MQWGWRIEDGRGGWFLWLLDILEKERRMGLEMKENGKICEWNKVEFSVVGAR